MMQTIGLIGGMSWESSAEYYRLLNRDAQRRLGGHHSAQLVLASVDFEPIRHAQHAGAWAAATAPLVEAARRLERAGADFALLCTNTMHKVAGALTAVLSVPLLHIGDVTADAVRAAGVHRVGLLGTAFTMEQTFLSDRLAAKGLHVHVPDPVDRAEVHRIIYEELCLGIVREESRGVVRAVIERLVAEGADGIVLGCTELELLLGDDDADVPLFPTTRLHVEAAVAAALA